MHLFEIAVELRHIIPNVQKRDYF